MLPENLILENEPTKTWREAELVIKFRLNPIKTEVTPLLEEWLNAPLPTLNEIEQYLFEKYLRLAKQDLNGWNEEELKMKFITHIISLGLLESGNGITTCFDRGLSGIIEGAPLSVKTDFMVASGYQNVIQQPFFHFQTYKYQFTPPFWGGEGGRALSEPMAQLLEAFMIAQTLNKKNIPLYGAEIVGENWKFVVMEGKDYCVSTAYNCLKRNELLEIIAILRKFKEILETRLLKM